MLKYLFAASLLAAVSSPLLAQSDEAQRTAEVSYADLDLTRGEDRAELDKRLVRATRRVCVPLGEMPLAGVQCSRKTLAQARNAMQIAVARDKSRDRNATLAAR